MCKKILSKIKSKSASCDTGIFIMVGVIMIILISAYKFVLLPQFESDINDEICEMENYKLSKEEVIQRVKNLTDKKRSLLFTTAKCTDASVDLIYKEDDSRTYRVTYKIDGHSHSKNIVISEGKNLKD